MSEPRKIWVLWWHYSDGSGQGITRVYGSKERADQDQPLIDDSMKGHEITEAEFIE